MIWKKRFILYKSFSLSLKKVRGQFVDGVSLFRFGVPGSPGRQGSGSRRQTTCGSQRMRYEQQRTQEMAITLSHARNMKRHVRTVCLMT